MTAALKVPGGGPITGAMHKRLFQVTHSGREMARFMKSLGAQVQDPPGLGSDAPFGKLC